MHGFSMKTKIATVVSVLFLLIFTSGAFMFLQTFEEHYKRSIADQQFELVSKIETDIDTQVREAQKILVNLSKLVPTGDLNDYPAIQKNLKRNIANRFFLRSFFDNGILLYSKAGKLIAEVPYSPDRYGKDFSQREYLKYTIKTQTPYISKPYRSTKPPYDPVVMFTAPVFNKKNELVAVLGGAVSLIKNNVLGEIARVRIGKTGYLYLYNSDRIFIVHPDRKLILHNAPPRGTNELFDRAIYEWFEGSGETTSSDGQPVLGTFKRFPNKDWILAAQYPLKDAYASLFRTRWYILAYTALGIALCVLVVLIVMRRNLSPLSELASQAENIGRAENHTGFVSVETGGEIGALAVSFNDMLKRLSDRENSLKTTLYELKEREARISSIVNTTIDGIITISEEKTIESFNRAAETIFGYNASEVIGKNISILMPEPYRSEHDGYILGYLKMGTPRALGKAREVMGQRKDGSIFPVELSLSEADLGNRRIFTGILRDITERKKAEEELQKLYNAVEHSSAVVLITDTQGNIEYVNPKFVQVTGYEKTETIGKTPGILKSGETSSEIYKDLWKTITSGEEWQGIFHNKKKNGEFFWAASSISPLKDNNGRITHFVGIQEDITAIKLFEQELKEAKEAAESANHAKSDFLASMSHEIRTPMNAIMGMAELLLEGPLDVEQKKYVETLRSASENLLNIINDILDISKIEAGYLELESTPFDLNSLIDTTRDIMSIRTREKGIGLVCRIMPDVPVHLTGDHGRLRQVLLNLIGNAIKFTDEGEITLEASLKEKNKSNIMIQFSISDTGIGIPKEKIDQIFEKFTQADSSTTRKYGGTGLGLAISQRLVELMGGKINVTSTVGVGSTFSFTASFGIHAGEMTIDAQAGETTVKIPAGTTIENAKPLRILLVDDSEDNRLLIKSFLKKTPFGIDTAENGKGAVDKFKTSGYDIVLMDIQMPIMDGYEATRQIRAWESLKGLKTTPVLALTAFALQEEIQKSHDAGCNGHLTKPIKKNDLIEAIIAHTKDLAGTENNNHDKEC